MKTFLSENIEYLIAGLTAIVGWLGGWRMKAQDLKSKHLNNVAEELSNLATIREMEKKLLADAKSQCDELREIIAEMKQVIEDKDLLLKEQRQLISRQKMFLCSYQKKYGKITI